MRLIDADKVLEEWDERTDDHRITDSEFHRMINEDLPIIDLGWHYPSKGEYPTEVGNYLVVYGVANALVRSIKFYNPIVKEFDTTLPVIAWMPLPELPKEEA